MAIDTGSKEATEFFAESGLTMDVLKDVNTGDGFKLGPIPRTIFLNRDGKIIADKTGKISLEQFETELAKIL